MENRNVYKYIISDVYRYTGKTSFGNLLKNYICDAKIRFHVALRMRQGKGIVEFLGKVLWVFNRYAGRELLIYPAAKIGYGFYIGHPPVYVHSSSVIGNNVHLSQFTTIGSNLGKAAEIGDNTYIGPNVVTIENVKIGSNVTIGAGSIVKKDIPDNATAVGNYAKVINYDNPGRYTQNNRWTDFSED